MAIYKNSKMTTIYNTNKHAWENHPCVIKMDESKIVVEYEDDGRVIYTGEAKGVGHYFLKAKGEEGDGFATLHIFPGDSVLEGHWVVREPGQERRGMWQIILG